MKIGSGATPRGGRDAYRGGATALIRSQNVHNWGFSSDGLAFIDEQQADELSNVVVERSDVLLNITGDSVARCCMAPEEALPARVNQHVLIIRTDPSVLHSRYLRYWMVAPTSQQHLLSLASAGATRNALTRAMVSDLRFDVPPLLEQRAIASVLGALDDKIDLNRRMCQTLEEMARALFKSWFVDFDPVRAKMEGRDPGLPKEIADLFPSRLVDSELGPIPEGWTASDFGCIAEVRREGVAANQIDAATNYIGLEHMPRRSISLWEWESGDAIESNKSRFAKGDILFGKLRPYFHKVGVAPIDGVCSTDIIVIQPKNRAAFGAVLGLASSDDFVAYTDKRSAGTRMPRTNWSDMAAYPVAVPPSAVLSAHDSIIRPLAERIASAIHEVRLLQALRDTLLPKLISGEVRLPASLGSMQEVAS
jgi:type I restriction enzyme S subunit